MKIMIKIMCLLGLIASSKACTIEKLPEKLIVIVTPSYNNKDWWEWNLVSLLNQAYSNYYIIITDDCSTDGTGQAIQAYIDEHKLSDKVILIQNSERHGALYNLYMMIHSCPNEAIIATVDGDDKLPDDPYVLARLNEIYSTQDVWLTYGQFQEYPSGGKGWCSPMPEHIVKNNAFREFNHIPSHLRTFYAWLFKAIKLEDMLYYGDFYSMTWDYVMMLPMIEMAGERHVCFTDTINYIYNNANTISDHRISRQLQAYLAQIVRNKKRYSRLPEKLEYFGENFDNEKADIIIFSEKKDPQLLDNFIQDIFNSVKGYGNIYVLYYPASKQAGKYLDAQEKYPSVSFFEVEEYRSNFRPMLQQIYHNLSSNYVIFCQADTKIHELINLHDCIKALEETKAYTFCLRLSKINPYKAISTRLPVIDIGPDLCAWDFAIANDIWACANNVDMSLYRKTDLIAHVLEEGYMEPSSAGFQALWANEGDLSKIGLCFKYPKVSRHI